MKRTILSATLAFASLSLVACGGGGGGTSGSTYGSPTSAPVVPTPASEPQTATVGSSAAFVSSSNQHTLYTFGGDTANASNCTGACAGVWPPYTAPAGTQAPAGSGFGIIARSDGSLQWTYQNFPLYNYSGDAAAAQDNGQGINSFGGVWGTARPAGSGTGGATPSPGGCVGYYC